MTDFHTYESKVSGAAQASEGNYLLALLHRGARPGAMNTTIGHCSLSPLPPLCVFPPLPPWYSLPAHKSSRDREALRHTQRIP